MTVWVRQFVTKLLAKVEKVKKPLGFEVCTEATLTPTELDRAEKLWAEADPGEGLRGLQPPFEQLFFVIVILLDSS